MALRWSISIALLAQIAFGLLLDEIAARGIFVRGAVINLHKAFGVVLALPIMVRLAWRRPHRPPAWVTSVATGQGRMLKLVFVERDGDAVFARMWPFYSRFLPAPSCSACLPSPWRDPSPTSPTRAPAR